MWSFFPILFKNIVKREPFFRGPFHLKICLSKTIVLGDSIRSPSRRRSYTLLSLFYSIHSFLHSFMPSFIYFIRQSYTACAAATTPTTAVALLYFQTLSSPPARQGKEVSWHMLNAVVVFRIVCTALRGAARPHLPTSLLFLNPSQEGKGNLAQPDMIRSHFGPSWVSTLFLYSLPRFVFV